MTKLTDLTGVHIRIGGAVCYSVNLPAKSFLNKLFCSDFTSIAFSLHQVVIVRAIRYIRMQDTEQVFQKILVFTNLANILGTFINLTVFYCPQDTSVSFKVVTIGTLLASMLLCCFGSVLIERDTIINVRKTFQKICCDSVAVGTNFASISRIV